MHQPSADQQRGDDLELSAQVHQEDHREFEPKDSHVELEHAVDAPVVGLVPRVVATGRLDDADAELPYDLDARSGAPVHGALHERNEDELRDEERERRARVANLMLTRYGDEAVAEGTKRAEELAAGWRSWGRGGLAARYRRNQATRITAPFGSVH